MICFSIIETTISLIRLKARKLINLKNYAIISISRRYYWLKGINLDIVKLLEKIFKLKMDSIKYISL